MQTQTFALSTKQNGTIKDLWNPNTLEWDINLIRNLRDQELQQWEKLRNTLPVPEHNHGTNIPIWKLNSNGIFSIASVKKALQANGQCIEISDSFVFVMED